MRILLASSEVHPYSKTGGLADMVGALGKYLAQMGGDVAIATPLYAGIRGRFPEIRRANVRLKLPLGGRTVEGHLWKLQPQSRLTVYFVEQPEFFNRPGLYQDRGADYPDNAARFIYFSKAVVFLARFLRWLPEMVHLHDWQTGPVPLFVRHQKKLDGWSDAPATCFTIHNLAYQGNFPNWDYSLTNLPWDYFHPEGAEFYGGFNCLKTGLVYSDLITTVSPRYAREITTEQYGCGLDGLLRARQNSLHGILNGVDYSEWKTRGNPYLKHSYNPSELQGKTKEKTDLQKHLGLAVDERIPLFGSVTRLADQKGMEILLGALEEMLSTEMQFVLLGSGQLAYEKAFRKLASRFAGKAAVKIGYDTALAHRIEAGCDFFLMPSKFEPCGLNQMYSLRYGAIPVVRVTGGLDDSVVDITEDKDRANGIKFQEYSVRALAKAIRKALVLFGDGELLLHYRQNAMETDFSWERTAAEYLKLYQWLADGTASSQHRDGA